MVSLWSPIHHFLVGDFVFGKTSMRYASLAALLAATAIGFATYVSNGWFRSSAVSLRPDLISGIIAVALVAALYTRRLIEWAPSLYSVLSLLLNVTVTAILVEALLGGGGSWLLPGVTMPSLVVLALILTWVGMRAVAPIGWLLVVVVGFVNLERVSAAMGFWGYLLIVLIGLGVALQLMQSARNFMPDLRHDFVGNAVQPASAIDAIERDRSDR